MNNYGMYRPPYYYGENGLQQPYYDDYEYMRHDKKKFTPPKTYLHKKGYTTEEAIAIAKELDIDFNKSQFNIEQFRMGLDVELEHGTVCPHTNVTSNNPILTGKIALAHLFEIPDYYTRLKQLEDEGNAYWANTNIYKNC